MWFELSRQITTTQLVELSKIEKWGSCGDRALLDPGLRYYSICGVSCIEQLAGVFTFIFNLSLPISEIPTCFNYPVD